MLPEPKSLKEIKENRKPLRDVNEEYLAQLKMLDRFALWITESVGSMGFFILVFVWTFFWLIWNTFGPLQYRFDAFPAFVLWLFISNVMQLFLTPLIMVGQNLQTQHAEVRAEADLEVNQKSEVEIETILEHLEYQNDLILEILKRVEHK